MHPAALVLVAGLGGCVGGVPDSTSAQPEPAVLAGEGTGSIVTVPAAADPGAQPIAAPADDLSSGVLMPRGEPDDAQVMKVAGLSVRKSHIYDRIYEEAPQNAKRMVDSLVRDILLARQAEKHGIFVDPAMVDEIVDEEIQRIETDVKERWKGKLSVAEFLDREKGVSPERHRLLARRSLARKLYRYYVIRFLAMLEDRVQMRIIKHHDKATIDRLQKKARDGADFASLAVRESEDRFTQRSGGLLPPLSRDSKKVYVKAAFALKSGEVSEVLTLNRGGVVQHYLLYCMRHMPGRKVSFKAAKPELDRAWLKSPITPAESGELYLRLRAASERRSTDAKNR